MADQPTHGNERPSVVDPETRARHAEYWSRNIRYVLSLVAVWFVVSYGFGIVLAEPLNTITIPGTGFPLGFWFAQQGSIFVFIALIFYFSRAMSRFERESQEDQQ